MIGLPHCYLPGGKGENSQLPASSNNNGEGRQPPVPRAYPGTFLEGNGQGSEVNHRPVYSTDDLNRSYLKKVFRPNIFVGASF